MIFQFQQSIQFQLPFYVVPVLFRFYCISVFENLFRFSFSFYFRFRVYYIDQQINNIHLRIVTMLHNSNLALAGISTFTLYSISQSHQVLVQFQKHTHSQIFRQSVSAASCKPSAYGEHAFHVGLGGWRSYLGPVGQAVHG